MLAPDISNKEPPEKIAPHPKRYAWLKRAAATVACGIIALVMLRAWWVRSLETELDQTIRAYQLRGEPIDAAQLKSPPVPNAENGALFLNRAALAAVATQHQIDEAMTLYYGYKIRDDTRLLVAANGRALDLLRQARIMQAANWDSLYPDAFGKRPDVQSFHTLELLIWHAARHAEEDGNFDAYVEFIRDQMAICRILSEAPDSVMQLEGLSWQQLYWFEIYRDEGLKAAVLRPSVRRNVQQLIRELLVVPPVNRFYRLLVQRRVELLHAMIHPNEDPKFVSGWQRKWLIVLRFVFRARLLRGAMDRFARINFLVERFGKPTAEFDFPFDTEWARPWTGAEWIADDVATYPAWPEGPRQVYSPANNQYSAIALAWRLYQADHSGLDPNTMQDLMPDYMPENARWRNWKSWRSPVLSLLDLFPRVGGEGTDGPPL